MNILPKVLFAFNEVTTEETIQRVPMCCPFFLSRSHPSICVVG